MGCRVAVWTDSVTVFVAATNNATTEGCSPATGDCGVAVVATISSILNTAVTKMLMSKS